MPGGYGMGSFPIPYHEIEAYTRLTGAVLGPLDLKLMRELSEEYMLYEAEQFKKEQESKPAPGQPALKNVTAMSDTQGIKDLFRNLATKTQPRAKLSQDPNRDPSQE